MTRGQTISQLWNCDVRVILIKAKGHNDNGSLGQETINLKEKGEEQRWVREEERSLGLKII